MTAEAVRSVATLVKARRRRPLPAGMLGHLRNIATGLGDLGAFALDRLRRPDEARASWSCAPRQSRPQPGLPGDAWHATRDRFGLPVARVDWRPASSDRASIRAAGGGRRGAAGGRARPRRAHAGRRGPAGAAGGQLPPPRRDPDAPDPQGVVDADCRVHGVRNLYVAGSSVFPTYEMLQPDAHRGGAGSAVGRPPEEAGRLIGGDPIGPPDASLNSPAPFLISVLASGHQAVPWPPLGQAGPRWSPRGELELRRGPDRLPCNAPLHLTAAGGIQCVRRPPARRGWPVRPQAP